MVSAPWWCQHVVMVILGLVMGQNKSSVRRTDRQTRWTHTASCPRYVIAAGHSQASQGRGLARLLASARLPARHVSRQTDSSRRLRKHGSTVMETTGAPPSGLLGCLSSPCAGWAHGGYTTQCIMHQLQERERERARACLPGSAAVAVHRKGSGWGQHDPFTHSQCRRPNQPRPLVA